MYLRNLKATNWIRDEYNQYSSSTLITQSGANQSNLLHRAARLKISVAMMDEAYDDYVYEAINPVLEPEENYLIWQDEDYYDQYDGWGYHVVDMTRITLSGYAGETRYTWFDPTSYPTCLSTDNPLYMTEFHYVDSAMGPCLSPELNGGHQHPFMDVTPYTPAPNTNGTTFNATGAAFSGGSESCQGAGYYCPGYKVFTEANVKEYGHKNVLDVANYYNLIPGPGVNNDQLFMGDYTVSDVSNPAYGLPGVWYDETGQSYTGPLWTAEALWSNDVDYVVIFDSKGIEWLDSDGSGIGDTWGGKQGNEIDVFVVLKDYQDDLSYGYYPETNTGYFDSSNPPQNEFQKYGVYLSNMTSITGMTPYEEGGVTLDVDLDGSALWIPFKGVVPTWDPIGDEDTGKGPTGEDEDIDEDDDIMGEVSTGTAVMSPMPAPVVVEIIHGGEIDGVPVIDSEVDIVIDSRRPRFRMTEFPPKAMEVSKGHINANATRMRAYGLVKPGFPVIVATIKVSVGVTENEDGTKSIKKYLSKVPRLKTNKKGLGLKIAKKEKINNKISCYYLNLTYTQDKPVKNAHNERLPVEILVETKDFPTILKKDKSITNLVCNGGSNVDSGGDRKIIVTGTPESEFCLVVNETDENIDHSVDESILSNSFIKEISWYGKNIRAALGTIDKTGAYTIDQKFPDKIVKNATINDSRSGHVSSITFKDTRGIKEGDHVYSTVKTGIHYGEKLAKVSSVSSKTVIFDQTIHDSNWSNGAQFIFKRNRYYTANLVPEHCSDIETTAVTQKIFKQIDKPKITISHTIAGSNYEVVSNNGVDVGLTNGQDYNYVITPKDHNAQKNRTEVNFSLKLKLATGSHRWTSRKWARFFEDKKWTNLDHSVNGGTFVKITDIKSSTLNVNDEITLSYTLIVKKWGITDLTIVNSLDDMFGITT